MMELPPSQLPRDPSYWEGMAQRIRSDAETPLARYAAAGDSWLRVLDRCAAWLAPLAAAAMLLLWFALPVQRTSLTADWMERSLAPTEVPARLLEDDRPPPPEALLVHFSPRKAGGHK
ncbi:MAG TPA: hypothetical protein VLV83_10415 [Acidobacteriota bacterium]|nr:hypothetical protein [Acidobacteriota bacterium]